MEPTLPFLHVLVLSESKLSEIRIFLLIEEHVIIAANVLNVFVRKNYDFYSDILTLLKGPTWLLIHCNIYSKRKDMNRPYKVSD